MSYTGEYFSLSGWKDIEILNLDDFLQEHRYTLRRGLVTSSISRLSSSELYPYTINLGGCTIDIVGEKAAIEAIPSLEFALKNYVESEQ